MKAEIKKGMLILEAENKKESKKIKKFLEENSSSAIIPKSKHKLAYWKLIDIYIAVV